MPANPLFVITLDTEPDNEWGRPRLPTTQNARFVPRFHDLCLRHGFRVTYLMTLEMAEDPFLRDYLAPRLRAGECEVGAHLHPWNTPPLVQVTDDDLRHHPYPFEYPPDVQEAKLSTLIAAIERHYAVHPTSYKAGRWGLDGVHAGLLERMGFRVDTSVCPGVNWGPSKGDPRRSGGPNYTTAAMLPYQLSREDVCRSGGLSVWEVPPTIVFYSALGRWVPGIRALYRRHRLVRRLFDRKRLGMQWLRPYPYMTVERLKRVLTLARRARTPVFNFTFHSSELMPGGSPYNQTAESIEDLFVRLDRFFRYLRSTDVVSATLTQAGEHVALADNGSGSARPPAPVLESGKS